MQLVNHGVSASLLEKAKKEIQDFFNLPMEEKKKYWQYPGEQEGFGQAFVLSEEQKLDWGDLYFMITLPHHFRKPHLFPKLPLSFRDTLEIYALELKNLAITILTTWKRHLKWKAEKWRNSLTILLRINEVEGLQIKKDGKWVPIKPLPNAFIINIGDVLEVITNGVYRSITHRATINSERERLSIATFYNPKYEGEIGPARSLISQQKPAFFKRLGAEEYFEGLFARRLTEKS
ncbi:hypothetical protein SLEP1_g42768 [Rubroshorea leprosula]|uniref:Fe2OG dioxygenase domain-containing protein n=1 Tax=Rubroshorea leprosula TaxID=152421 RepID=A0AAV5LAX8_9ROSI|nr:hypothetical protein SLEP1_g42768 [Rubroshorea leprosula]